MISPRQTLETALSALPDVSIEPYKDTALICVLYRGREIAHFHDQQEIDIRIPTKFARRANLGEPLTSGRHPNRSKKSIWRIMRFHNQDDVTALVALFEQLIDAEYKPA